jgi:hypothetical protein
MKKNLSGGPCRFAFRRTTPTLAELLADLDRQRQAISDNLTCPISREQLTPGCAVLASDGYLYDRDALIEWAEACVARQEPVTSPVTRAVLRPWAVAAKTMLEDAGLGEASDAHGPSPPHDAQLTPLPSLAPPFSPMVVVRKGTQRVGRWETPFGVASRMLLGWDDHDVAEWCFPVRGEAGIGTPPPAAQLIPLAQPLLRWLGIPHGEFSNPEHILTAWVRIHPPALRGERSDACPWRTFEEIFVELARPKRGREREE